MNSRRIYTTKEIPVLYEEERLSLRQIARRIGITHEGVRYILIRAGVKIEKRKPARKVHDVELIKRLYVEEGLTREEVAKRLKVSRTTISNILKGNGVELRRPRSWRRKYPELAELRVGESVTLPRPVITGKWQTRFHRYAKNYGIRISVTTVNDSTIRVTRLEDSSIEPYRPANHRPDLSTEQMRRMYEIEGLSLEQIADRVGIQRPSVAGRLKRAGVVLKKRGGQRRKFDAELVKRLYLDEKLNVAQIAKQLQSARITVANFLKANGIALRGSSRKQAIGKAEPFRK